jgi:hypothetical protein
VNSQSSSSIVIRFYLLLAFPVIISVFSMILIGVSVQAQGNEPADCPPTYPVPCSSPLPKPKVETWPLGASVKVNIDPSFSSGQANAIETAYRNWQAAGAADGNGSGVKFTFTHSETPLSMSPAPGTFHAQVWNRVYPDAPGKAGGTAVSSNDTNAVSQEIWINPQTTDPCATAQTAAHEIGHGFGLGECPNCGQWSSVMVEGDNGYNSSNGTYGPTICDNKIAQSVGGYPKSATLQEGGGGGTTRGGEENQAFYYSSGCTTYYWVLYYSWDDGETWFEQDRWVAGCW